ncbi:ExbD/TolR family protein [Prevotella brunnea]|uniref:ExbD/TolR family protein n=1 Tax=Prevotella brunnea TaxID=2508867 RepID=UPI002805517C|nr:biopolymer transporter ExbD [Prevotella brunnea]
MIFHRKIRKVPGLNASSTADISFMLLIFFLVTTSMDIDKGITRQLPPIQKEKEQLPTSVSSNLVMKLYVTADDKLLLNDEPIKVTKLRSVVEKFIANRGKNHIIQLQTSREASYDAYFRVQSEIIAAYHVLRDKSSEDIYGKPYSLCDEEQQKLVNDKVPQRISEVYEFDKKGKRE